MEGEDGKERRKDRQTERERQTDGQKQVKDLPGLDGRREKR